MLAQDLHKKIEPGWVLRIAERITLSECERLKRQLEQDLDGQTELDRCIREDRRATGAAIMRREPGHLLVQPDQQRSALAQRSRVAGPVRRAIAGG